MTLAFAEIGFSFLRCNGRSFAVARRLHGPLVSEQIHFIEPHAVRFLLVVAVHLECDIDLLLSPVRLRSEICINGVCLVGNGQSNVVDLVADALKLPDQMDPCVGRKMIAGNWYRNPNSMQRIPNVPFVSLVKVALRPPCPTSPAKRLIDVEL